MAQPHDLLADRDRRDELGAFDRLGLVGHRQQAGDAAAFPVVLRLPDEARFASRLRSASVSASSRWSGSPATTGAE